MKSRHAWRGLIASCLFSMVRYTSAMTDRLKLAREIAARTKPRFIEIPRERRRSVAFTEQQLTAMRGGLTAEEYRLKFIRKWTKRD
jgi:hypothetical protein